MVHYDLPEGEIAPAAEFIRACLHLNPDSEERPSTADLDAHLWLENAFMHHFPNNCLSMFRLSLKVAWTNASFLSPNMSIQSNHSLGDIK